MLCTYMYMHASSHTYVPDKEAECDARDHKHYQVEEHQDGIAGWEHSTKLQGVWMQLECTCTCTVHVYMYMYMTHPQCSCDDHNREKKEEELLEVPGGP